MSSLINSSYSSDLCHMAISSLYIFRKDRFLSVGRPTLWHCYEKGLECQTPFLMDNIAQVISQNRFSVSEQERSPLKDASASENTTGLSQSQTVWNRSKSIRLPSGYGSFYLYESSHKHTKIQSWKGLQRSSRQLLQFKGEESKTPRILETCPQAIELVTRKLACPFSLCHIVL